VGQPIFYSDFQSVMNVHCHVTKILGINLSKAEELFDED
jgi:hypothetical protein